MNAENLKESWLTRETQFSAFTNGSLLDFGINAKKINFLASIIFPSVTFVLLIHRIIKPL